MLGATLILAAPLLLLAAGGMPWIWLLGLGLLGVAPAVDLSVALVNHVVTRGYRATLLPALDLDDGVPRDLRTLVAVPTLLTSRENIQRNVESLEIHHLASPSGDLHFALLTDWTDATSERAEDDEPLLSAAREGVAELNRRYGPAPGGDRFLLLHRRRVWNASEGRWIGWERKRGKLAELNRLLRGATDTTYLDPPPIPQGVRYVITLDADTRLPLESARRLIGKMAHPLNRPRLDPEFGRVVEGYAILQPRVTPALPVGRQGSLFLRVFASASGIDPYAAAVSDVYQDLFGEGSYTGKGIYDVDAFEAALAGRVPELAAAQPRPVRGYLRPRRPGLGRRGGRGLPGPLRRRGGKRHHRWARGDWQLLPWMLGLGPRSGRGRARRRRADDRPLEDARQSAPLAFVARRSWRRCWRDGRRRRTRALVWTAFLLATMAIPPLVAGAGRDRTAAGRGRAAQPSARAGRRSAPGARAARPDAGVPGAPGLADGRRHPAHALAAGDASSAAGMDTGGISPRTAAGWPFRASTGA